MKVHELAKKFGVESSEIVEMLGKSSHLANVTEEEERVVAANYEETAEPKSKTILRFWSEIKDHQIKHPSGMITFDNFVLLAREDSQASRWLLGKDDRVSLEDAASRWPEISIVVDKPFESLEMRTNFGEMLRERVFSGPNKEVAIVRGLNWLYALFSNEEQSVIGKLQTVDAVIQTAIEKKSYIHCSEWRTK